LGRPYEKEIDSLADTYRWAVTARIEQMLKPIQSLACLPLITIGSGGSLTTADFVANLHDRYAGRLAVPLTPIEVAATNIDLRTSAVALFTAGGKNPDVIGAFLKIVVREPRRFFVLCSRRGTPLAKRAGFFSFVDFIELELPTRKDGFLATNSLLASAVLLFRSYAHVMGVNETIPKSLEELFAGQTRKQLYEFVRPLWDMDTLVVLHGPSTRSAARDLESKFTEAALGNVQVADFRNFAHGRHLWLAKRRATSAVLALLTPEDQGTGKATVALIPKSIPLARLEIPFCGPLANLAALVQVLHLVASAGQARGIDPGRPGVPKFGRRIYHLTAEEYGQGPEGRAAQAQATVLARKAGSPARTMTNGLWQDALANFKKRLKQARFRGIVLDYDGTLCGHENRYRGLKADMAKELARLLRHGTFLGIATGRGKSVREDLQKYLPEKYWPQVLVGYYNGGDIGTLAQNDCPDGSKRTVPALVPVEKALRANEVLASLVHFEPRLPQLQIEPRSPIDADTAWQIIQQVVQTVGSPGVTALRSSHAFDILAPGVGKNSVVERLRVMLDEQYTTQAILCIGDRGQWPGNDFSLLAGPYSLSVDEVSQDLHTCWNLASPGVRGIQATLEYLRAIKPDRDGLRIVLKPLRRRTT
jgi:fructoselysine-6-P-deglycase FrlB-like protein